MGHVSQNSSRLGKVCRKSAIIQDHTNFSFLKS